MRHELINGELRTTSPTGEEHAALTILLASSLLAACRANGVGRVLGGDPGFRLSSNPDTVRAPDVAVLIGSKAQGDLDPGYRTGAPDMAIEVISPHDLYTEVDEKVEAWLAAGCAIVLVVNPRRRTVAEHRADRSVRVLGIEDILQAEDLIPGWRLPLKELFTP
jgi:Uma2 family endonuclease